jgi:hypothetical protein
MATYLDASALVKLYVAEVGSGWVRRLVAGPGRRSRSGAVPSPLSRAGRGRAVSHIWTTRCVQGLFLRDSHQGLDCMPISGLSMER